MPTAKKPLPTTLTTVAPTNPITGLAKVSFSLAYLKDTIRGHGDVTSVRVRVTRDGKVVYTNKRRRSETELAPGRYQARVSLYRVGLPVTYFVSDFSVRAVKAPAKPRAAAVTTTVKQPVLLPASQSGLIRPLAGAVTATKVLVQKTAVKKAAKKVAVKKAVKAKK